MADDVTLADIRAAASRLTGQVLDTPLLESRTLSQILGARIFLKFENLQFTASFKERGALNKLAAMVESGARPAGVIAASAGNHAQGVAHHAQRLGLRAVIVMPVGAPAVKIERTLGFGAEVVLHGETFDDARAHALALAQAQQLSFVPAFDDPLVIAGQGTIGLEMLAARPDLEVLVVAVGGGGLISGVATAARAIAPGIEIVGVQAARFPAMFNAVKGTAHPVGGNTIADGIAVGHPGAITERIVRERVDDLVLVDEGDIEQAIVMLLEIEKTVVEGAGAAGLAAILKEPARYAGRLARIRIGARDAPGVLARITALVAEAGANIDEVHHQRAFSPSSAQNVDVELVLQTRNREHVRDILERLRAAGLDAVAA